MTDHRLTLRARSLLLVPAPPLLWAGLAAGVRAGLNNTKSMQRNRHKRYKKRNSTPKGWIRDPDRPHMREPSINPCTCWDRQYLGPNKLFLSQNSLFSSQNSLFTKEKAHQKTEMLSGSPNFEICPDLF